MKAPTSFGNVFLHREPVDMRRGIDGLCDIVASSGMGDLSTGKSLFVFTGKRRHSIKILYFDKSVWRGIGSRGQSGFPTKS